ncbi:MAG: sigma-70 family RNA polymerase sigma factor [Gilvibacter sp.]
MTHQLHKNVCETSVFERVYNTYKKDVHDFIYYKYGSQCEPNDKMQEAFIKLWENCAKVTPEKAKSFLFTVANNMALNDIKHQKVVLKHRLEQPKSYSNESPEFLLEKDEYFTAYQKVLASLSQEQRVAFTLSKIEGKKHQEIADMLGVTKKVVEYRIYSAFAVLKKELENFKIK